MSFRIQGRTAPLALVAALLAGCGHHPTAPTPPAPQVAYVRTAPVTLEWQAQARSLIAANRLNALAAGRIYAALSVAQHRAIRNVDASTAVNLAGPMMGFSAGGHSQFEARRGAVAGASAQVLSSFFPPVSGTLEQMVEDQGNVGPGQRHPQFTAGVGIGRTTGDEMIEQLKTDGFGASWTGTVPVGAGRWTTNSLPPAGVTLGNVRPYFLKSASQFRPAPPPSYLSAAFNTDLNEVLTRTTNLTAEERAFAEYWDFSAGTPTPIGFWNSTAAGYVEQRHLDEASAARIFALTHATVFDALIGCWEAKYYYWTLRPSQANPAISLALTLPNFPAYPSGHSCVSASATRVLTYLFPQQEAELAELMETGGLSRILAGIHYRFDISAGKQLGTEVAEFAILQDLP